MIRLDTNLRWSPITMASLMYTLDFSLFSMYWGRDIFSAGCHDDILFPIRDGQIPVLINLSHIPGEQPPRPRWFQPWRHLPCNIP